MSCGTRTRQSVRAILMAPIPPFIPRDQLLTKWGLHTAGTAGAAPLDTAGTANCVYCMWPHQAPLFGSRPRRPSCVCSGLEPHCRTSRCARPRPTPSPRYHSLHCWVLPPRQLLSAAPDDCGPPGPVASPVAVLQPLWLRNSATAPSCVLRLLVLLPGSSSLPGLAVSLGYERNHNHSHHPMSTPASAGFRASDGEVISRRRKVCTSGMTLGLARRVGRHAPDRFGNRAACALTGFS